MKNFTAVYLHRLKRKLLDDSGNAILTIKYANEPNEHYFLPPSLEYDIMEKRMQLKTPILRESKDLNELKEAGVMLYSIPVNQNTKFKTKQMEYLFLAKIGEAPISAVSVTVLTANNNKKGQHRLIFDDANRRVKLIGPYAGPMGEGSWIHLDEN